jgi:hypothetical protein
VNDGTTGAANGALYENFGTTNQLVQTNIRYKGVGNTRGFDICRNSGTLANCYQSNINSTDNTASNQAAHYSGASGTNYYISNCWKTNGNMFFYGEETCNLFINNTKILGPISVGFMQLIGTSKTYNICMNNNDHGGGNVLQSTGTSCTYNLNVTGQRNYNVRFNNAAGTTNTFNVVGSDGTLVLKSDFTATFTFQPGAIWYDVKATTPGLYGRGPSASTGLAVT